MASSFQNDPAHSFWHSDIGKSVAKAIANGSEPNPREDRDRITRALLPRYFWGDIDYTKYVDQAVVKKNQSNRLYIDSNDIIGDINALTEQNEANVIVDDTKYRAYKTDENTFKAFATDDSDKKFAIVIDTEAETSNKYIYFNDVDGEISISIENVITINSLSTCSITLTCPLYITEVWYNSASRYDVGVGLSDRIGSGNNLSIVTNFMSTKEPETGAHYLEVSDFEITSVSDELGVFLEDEIGQSNLWALKDLTKEWIRTALIAKLKSITDLHNYGYTFLSDSLLEMARTYDYVECCIAI